MIDFVIRPGDSEALYQPGQKILPPLDHLFGRPKQGTSGADFMNSNPGKPRRLRKNYQAVCEHTRQGDHYDENTPLPESRFVRMPTKIH